MTVILEYVRKRSVPCLTGIHTINSLGEVDKPGIPGNPSVTYKSRPAQ